MNARVIAPATLCYAQLECEGPALYRISSVEGDAGTLHSVYGVLVLNTSENTRDGRPISVGYEVVYLSALRTGEQQPAFARRVLVARVHRYMENVFTPHALDSVHAVCHAAKRICAIELVAIVVYLYSAGCRITSQMIRAPARS